MFHSGAPPNTIPCMTARDVGVGVGTFVIDNPSGSITHGRFFKIDSTIYNEGRIIGAKDYSSPLSNLTKRTMVSFPRPLTLSSSILLLLTICTFGTTYAKTGERHNGRPGVGREADGSLTAGAIAVAVVVPIFAAFGIGMGVSSFPISHLPSPFSHLPISHPLSPHLQSYDLTTHPPFLHRDMAYSRPLQNKAKIQPLAQKIC